MGKSGRKFDLGGLMEVVSKLDTTAVDGVAAVPEVKLIPLADIVYGEVLGRKVYLHLRDGSTVDYYEKLENLEHQVDGRFFRCHRSYLVNLDFVLGCGGGRVTLPQGTEIPVSRLREQDFTQALLRRMRERSF